MTTLIFFIFKSNQVAFVGLVSKLPNDQKDTIDDGLKKMSVKKALNGI